MAKYGPIKRDFYKFLENNHNIKKKALVDHFKALGYAQSNIYRWINIIETEGTIERKISGRPLKSPSKAI